MRIYRFLSAKYGALSLDEKRLKISRIHLLNDPFEWAAPVSNDRRHRQAFDRMKSQMSANSGVLCFSRSWRNPVMWSHYADHHHGLALGFDVNPQLFFKVVYRRSRIRCDWNLFVTDQAYALGIVSKVLRSKFDRWAYEEEVRAHVSLDHDLSEDGNYFLDFSDDLKIREVIIGPLCALSRDEVSQKVLQIGADIRVTKARLAFRDYRVVQQRDQSLW